MAIDLSPLEARTKISFWILSRFLSNRSLIHRLKLETIFGAALWRFRWFLGVDSDRLAPSPCNSRIDIVLRHIYA